MPEIILKEGTANVVSYTFLREMLINIKARYFHSFINHRELYQPPRTAFSQDTYHWLLSSCEYCNVFKNGLFYRTPPEVLVCRYSSKKSNAFILKSFANFTRKHLCWSLFLKNLQAEGLQLH